MDVKKAVSKGHTWTDSIAILVAGLILGLFLLYCMCRYANSLRHRHLNKDGNYVECNDNHEHDDLHNLGRYDSVLASGIQP